MQSAIQNNRATPHMLLAGAAGCGKTTTAKYIAQISNTKFINIACDSIKKRTDLFPIIELVNTNGYNKFGAKIGKVLPTILFIDEIHRLSIAAQEYIGILMEERYLAITHKEVKNSGLTTNKSENFIRWCPEFTLIGATTNDGKLSKPFRDRFKLRFIYKPYSLEDSMEIVCFHAQKLNINIDSEATLEIARRGRGVPRVLVLLLERCDDIKIISNNKIITKDITDVTFYNMGIDKYGFTKTDIDVLKALNDLSVPVGLDNIAIQLNESPKVLSETVEPYLIQQGLIIRTSKGRVITGKGRKYLIKNNHIEETNVVNYDIPLEKFNTWS